MSKRRRPHHSVQSCAPETGEQIFSPDTSSDTHHYAPKETAVAPPREIDWRGSIVGALLGAIVFFALMGYSPLISTNIGWLFGGDPSLYYLSAAFFQQSPWTFPPGLNSYYGLEIPSSIMYGDAIPLFAFFFKTVYLFTGRTVQYLGYWVLVCFVLQGLFGWILAGQFARSKTTKFCVALLVLFMPAFLAPTLQLAGYPISGQFLILGSLVLFFSPVNSHRKLLWTGIAVVSALCNPYLFAMVLGIWCADVVARARAVEQAKLQLGAEVVLVVSASLLVLWLAGFFVIGSGHQSGWFGMFRANLLSPFDSHPGHLKYSYFLPPTPKVSPDHNAPNFLGSGLIFLLAAAGLVCLAKRRVKLNSKSRVWPLIGATLLMFMYALSNRVSIGSLEFVIPIGGAVKILANLFSVSGRFMWPLMYLSLAGAIYVLSTRLDRRVACALFLAAAGLQVVDTRAAWGGTAERVSWRKAETWPTTLQSPFWERAGHLYKNIRTLPFANRKADYESVAYYALKHGMRTNAVYLARIDNIRVDLENERFAQEMKTRRLNSETIYILEERYLESARATVSSDDLLQKIDGVWVLAPRWHIISGCRTAPPGNRHGCLLPPTPGSPLELSGLKWLAWGQGRADAVRAEVSSDRPVDSALVSNVVLPPGSYLITACMNWAVEGPPSGAAHLSIHGQRKLITIGTSREERACRSAQTEIPADGAEARIAFGLGGWSTGKGRIRLEQLTVQPLLEDK